MVALSVQVVDSRNQVFALKRVQLAGLDVTVASAFISEVTFLRGLQQEPNVIGFVASEVRCSPLCVVASA